MLTRADVEIMTKDHPGYLGEAWLITVDGRDYVVSAASYGPLLETLVFPLGPDPLLKDGQAGVSGWDHEGAIADLLAVLNQRSTADIKEHDRMQHGSLVIETAREPDGSITVRVQPGAELVRMVIGSQVEAIFGSW